MSIAFLRAVTATRLPVRPGPADSVPLLVTVLESFTPIDTVPLSFTVAPDSTLTARLPTPPPA